MSKLWDKNCVFCTWDDNLKDKEVFVADFLSDLMDYVETDEKRYVVTESANIDYPFFEQTDRYRYCYYDPLYDVKKAYYKDGKVIQYWDWAREVWEDVHSEPMLHMRIEYYRIKPIEGGKE